MNLGPVLHDHTAPQSHDWARRRLRTGAAKVAQEIRDTGRNAGLGLRAEALLQGMSSHNLGRLAEGMNPVLRPTQVWCGRCKQRTGNPWQAPGHEHV